MNNTILIMMYEGVKKGRQSSVYRCQKQEEPNKKNILITDKSIKFKLKSIQKFKKWN